MMTCPTIVEVELARLTHAPRNARTHSKKQIGQIANSIRDFGFRIPILCNASGQIIAGHGRFEAASQLGRQTVPAIFVEDLSPEQMKAFALVENKLSERGGWDSVALSIEVRKLALSIPSLDLSTFGFEVAELDILLGDEAYESAPSAAISNRMEPAVTRRGDIWEIGRHRVLCGNSTLAADYQLLMGEERAQVVFTDPPYNLPIKGHVSGKGKVSHPEFKMASGEMTVAEFKAFLRTTTNLLIDFSVPGSIHFICMDYRHMREMLDAAVGYSELKNLCVWAKPNAGMGSLYRSQHELIFVLKSGKAAHINNVRLGKDGRNRTNIWRYGSANSFSATRDEDLRTHPTVKPVEMVADAIKDCSKRGGIVLDAFLGSGTTLVAAEQTGRRGRAIEIDPWYVDAALQRIAAVVGTAPRLLSTNATFDDVRTARMGEGCDER